MCISINQSINQSISINMHLMSCRPEKGKSGSNGPTPKVTPQSTPRGLGSTWGSATPINQTPKGAPATVKTALQDMKQVLLAPPFPATALPRHPFTTVLQLQTCLLQHTDTSGPDNMLAIISIIVQAEGLVLVSCASCKTPMAAFCPYMYVHTHTLCTSTHLHHGQQRHIKRVMH